MWNIEEVAPLMGKMNALALHANFNLGLGGGVLNNGYSNKDLDIICLPRSRKFANREELIEEMKTILQSELQAYDFKVENLEERPGGWSEPNLDGRKVFMMEFKRGIGIHEVRRIDWIFVDYEIEQ